MAVLSQDGLLGQQRLDIPYIRQIESSICADFDVLGADVFTDNSPIVVSGFTISVSPSPLGLPASNLYLNTASGTMIHPLATRCWVIFYGSSKSTSRSLKFNF
jgi:hypothetical protein